MKLGYYLMEESDVFWPNIVLVTSKDIIVWVGSGAEGLIKEQVSKTSYRGRDLLRELELALEGEAIKPVSKETAKSLIVYWGL